MEILKWLPLAARSVIGCARHGNSDPIVWNTQSDQSVELPPRLSEQNHPSGAEPGTVGQCIQAWAVCPMWETNRGLPLWSSGVAGHCRTGSLWGTGTVALQGIWELAVSDVMGLLFAAHRQRGWFSRKCSCRQPFPARVVSLGIVLTKSLHCQPLTPK